MIKKPRKKRAPKSYMMVIRVNVPASLVPALKVRNVVGVIDRNRLYDLEILSAYYDKSGQPDAKQRS